MSFVEGANLRRGVGLSTFGYIGEMGSSSGRRPQQPPPPLPSVGGETHRRKTLPLTSELPLPMLVDFRKSPKLWREPQSKTESLYPLLLSLLLAIVLPAPLLLCFWLCVFLVLGGSVGEKRERNKKVN